MLRTGQARLRACVYKDDRTKNLLRRLRPGGIAVVAHQDLDQLAAEALIQGRAAAVINTRPFVSGRYPSRGALRLLEAGVPLFEVSDPRFWRMVAEGDEIEIDCRSGLVQRAGKPLVTALPITRSAVAARVRHAERNLGRELDRFLDNTLHYARREKHLLFGPVPLPPVRTPIRGRHVLIVVRGQGYRDDLRTVVPYIRDFRPVLIGVDGGADALLEIGCIPDIVIGDMDSV
ncbi:MAG TPA: putative cytokinetic ring protein SteA, partial [Bacillota bacterium]